MHFVQTARLAPRISMGPGATQGTPEIVEGNLETKIIGIKDKFIFEPDENLDYHAYRGGNKGARFDLAAG